MGAIIYVCVTWALVVIGSGLLAYGLAREQHHRSRTGLVLLVAAVLVTVALAAANGVSTDR